MPTLASERVYRIGDATVTRVLDTRIETLTPAQLLPDWGSRPLPAGADALVQRSMTDDAARVALSIHSWLVRVGGKVILVDTGIGNGKDRPFSPLFHRLETDYLARLAAAGVRPEEVDLVLLTHLHVDHVGWNTVRGASGWEPTFPRARYVYAGAEEAFFHTPAGAARRMVYEDSVKPLADAGLVVRLPEQGGPVDEHFHFHPTPGHSAGHMSIALESVGEVALFAGDVMHSPVQLLMPDWNSCFCAEPEPARASRAWVQEFVRTRDATCFSSHFGDTSVVRHRPGATPAWSFV